jgi:hypothetical protein
MAGLSLDDDAPPESRSYASSCLLASLADPDLEVASAALAQQAALASISPATLLPALAPLARRMGAALLGPARLPSTKAARPAARRALQLAASMAEGSTASGVYTAVRALVNASSAFSVVVCTSIVHQYCLWCS